MSFRFTFAAAALLAFAGAAFAQPNITTASLPNGTVGQAYNHTLSAKGGKPPYTWTVLSGSLPAGVTLAPDGTFSGTPTNSGTFSFLAQVTDRNGATDTMALSVAVIAPLKLTTTSLNPGTVGAPYSQTLGASGGSGGYTYSISAGSLPAGLGMSTAGAITGTPTTAGTSNFTAQVKDSSAATDTQALSIKVNPPPLTVSPGSLANGTVGAAYSQTLSATGGSGGNSWTVSAGSLPAGLTLSAAGVISGTPTAAGTSNFTAQVRDSSNTTATNAFTILVNPAPLSVTTASLANGNVGSPYSQSLAATGGTGGYTWSITAGSLPAGLSLNGATVSGTPTAAGTNPVTVQVRDSSGATATKGLSITVSPAPLSITTGSLSNGTVGAPYSQTLGATGGTGTYTWSIPTGTLPAGLSLSGATISGTPSAAGTSTFTAQVSDGSVVPVTKQLSILVNPAALSISTASLANGTVGAPYSQSLAASGGTGKYTWSITSGSLPAGLSLNGATIAGTPTAAGTSGFTVQVSDGTSTPVSNQFSILVNPAALSISTVSLANGTVGAPYSQSLGASGGSGTYTWSITSGSLPAGLSLNGATISGTPTAAGTSGFTVQVSDGSSAPVSKQFSILVNPAALTITTASLPPGTVATPYSQSLGASGGSGTYAWSVRTGSLPAGLSLSGDTIAGTPTAPGTSNFTVQVSDGAGAPVTKQLSIVVNPSTLTISTASLPNGTVGAPYSQTLAATGGTGTYTWSVSAGSLPSGLSLNGAIIAGTPTAAGTSGFTVQVSDGASAPVTKQYSIVVNPAALTISTASLPNGTVGAPYSQSLAATGGTGTYTWSISSGSLPAGLSLNGATIAGTPTAAGTSGFTVRVSDGTGAPVSKQLSIAVNPAGLSVTTASLSGGAVGAPYSQTLSASGGTGSYTWSISSGSLPAGLSLTSGTIAGTPTAAGTSGFTVQVRDGAGTPASKQFAITIAPATVTITTAATLPSGTVGSPYSVSVAASGGAGNMAWSVVSGSLPAGLSLNGSTITGTPTAPGTAGFTLQVSDGAGGTASKPFAITINASTLSITTPANLPSGSIGTAYSQTLGATGGTGTYTWSLTSGSLPPGLNLNGAAIVGTPTIAGTFGFTLQVTDASGASISKQFALAVAGPPLVISTTSLPDATAGSPYSQNLAATGGSGIYSWTTIAGQFPPGLSLNSGSGVISGSPTFGGTFNFTVQVTDSTGARASTRLAINVRTPLTITTQPTLATGSAGSPYSQTLTTAGGSGSVTWSTVSGTLPNGLTLRPNGVLDGTPTQVGTFTLTAQATDAAGTSVTGTFTLTIASGLTIATPPVLPGATAGAPYSLALQSAGGSAPYVWSVTSGTLPGGLTFGADGRITGSATTAGTFTFTAQITDANSNRASKDFTLTVAPALVITTGPTLPNGASSAPYQATLAAAGGTPPYLWTVTAGSMPPGLTLDSSGSVSGTPSGAGAFTFTASVTDSSNLTTQRQFSITIGQGLTISATPAPPAATAGEPYTYTFTVSGGQPPYSWGVAGGSLPPGLALNAATGAISGTPSAGGVFNFTVQATDSAKLSAASVQTIVVGLPSLSALSINGPPANVAALQQPSLDIAIDSPYPATIAGTLTLAFAPGGANPADDPAVQFSTGGRTATFTIPANTTHAVFSTPQLAVQTGSVTGTITITLQSLQTGGSALPVPAGLTRTIQVTPGVPVVRTVALVQTSGGFQVQIVGLSTTREVKQAIISFQPAAGSNLQTGQLTVPLTDAAQAWFQSPDSRPFGGQFTLTLPFTVQGGTNVVGSVSVILSNTIGDSPAASGAYN